jgi:hypothetical protein
MAKKTTIQPFSRATVTREIQPSGSGPHNIIMSVITIILIYCIYNYLRGLENCECVNQQLVDRIKNIELLLLVSLTLSLIIGIFYGHSKLVALFINIPIIMYVAVLYLLFIIGIESYLVYEVYKLRQSLPKKCECADKWQLNLLYVQCVWYAVAIALIIFSFLMMCIMKMRS